MGCASKIRMDDEADDIQGRAGCRSNLPAIISANSARSVQNSKLFLRFHRFKADPQSLMGSSIPNQYPCQSP